VSEDKHVRPKCIFAEIIYCSHMTNRIFLSLRPCFLTILTFLTFQHQWVLQGQGKQVKVATIGFYNLENLFDTENDTLINDEDFLPDGNNTWTDDKYEEKLDNMAHVISQIGIDLAKQGLSILGVSEIENRRVLEDLVKRKSIAQRGYKIVHYDSPDGRGVDVGMLYNPNHFTVTESSSIPLIVYGEDGRREFTRDILLVGGLLDGDPMYIMVNHWPSRRGGEKASQYKRNKGAAICKSITDSLYRENPNAKVIIMGDLNDDPTSESVKSILMAKGKKSEVGETGLYNPFYDFFRRGLGSNAYQDSWSLFDQIIISAPFLNDKQDGYKFHKANVFNKEFLIQRSGRYQGYPFRTFSGNTYIGGYSDHFPTLIYLTKDLP